RVLLDQLSGGRVERDLAGAEEQVAGADRLAVWADRGGGVVGLDDAALGCHGPNANAVRPAASMGAAVLSLYRRHRPRTFDEVVGQEHIVRTLGNAIQLGKVHHAYLFVGSRGTGKTSMAKLLACALNAKDGPRVDF